MKKFFFGIVMVFGFISVGQSAKASESVTSGVHAKGLCLSHMGVLSVAVSDSVAINKPAPENSDRESIQKAFSAGQRAAKDWPNPRLRLLQAGRPVLPSEVP